MEDDKLSPARHGLVTPLAALLPAGNGPGQTNTIKNMRIKNIICSVVTLGLLTGGLTACVTEKEEGKEGKEGEKGCSSQTRSPGQDYQGRGAEDRLGKGARWHDQRRRNREGKGQADWSFDIATPGLRTSPKFKWMP